VVANACNVSLETTDGMSASPGRTRLELVSAALRISCQSLEQRGTFLPFGLALNPHHELVTISAFPGAGSCCAEDLILLLQAGLEAGRRARRYRATVLVFESEIPLVGGNRCVRAVELRLCDESSAGTLCFPHAREGGEVRLEWPHWRGEVSNARFA